jgi:hypothetical protein
LGKILNREIASIFPLYPNERGKPLINSLPLPRYLKEEEGIKGEGRRL